MVDVEDVQALIETEFQRLTVPSVSDIQDLAERISSALAGSPAVSLEFFEPKEQQCRVTLELYDPYMIKFTAAGTTRQLQGPVRVSIQPPKVLFRPRSRDDVKTRPTYKVFYNLEANLVRGNAASGDTLLSAFVGGLEKIASITRNVLTGLSPDEAPGRIANAIASAVVRNAGGVYPQLDLQKVKLRLYASQSHERQERMPQVASAVVDAHSLDGTGAEPAPASSEAARPALDPTSMSATALQAQTPRVPDPVDVDGRGADAMEPASKVDEDASDNFRPASGSLGVLDADDLPKTTTDPPGEGDATEQAQVLESGGVFIALGSNVGDRLDAIEAACRAIDEDPDMRIVQTSSLYETEPMYVEDQARFLNGACEIETQLPPLELLDRLQALEKELGRVKLVEKGPRSIDLDILLYKGQRYHDERLTIPHALMTEREFVLRPLQE